MANGTAVGSIEPAVNEPEPANLFVLGCEHKYWSRLQQRQVAPEYVPMFEAVDPFNDAAMDAIGVDTPFWIKPVKSFSSHLGFRVGNFREARQMLIFEFDESTDGGA